MLRYFHLRKFGESWKSFDLETFNNFIHETPYTMPPPRSPNLLEHKSKLGTTFLLKAISLRVQATCTIFEGNGCHFNCP